MAGGYRKPSGDGLESVRDQFRKIRGRLAELEKASGTSLKSLVAQVQNALANLAAQVAVEISAQSYTRTQIDAKVASPGDISPGTVNASGNVISAGTLRALSVYHTTLTTSYRAVWVTSVDGQLGYVPSSARFKRDVEALAEDPELLLQLQVVAFRYTAAVEAHGDSADVEVGLIAERVHELGLYWLVDYEERLTGAGRSARVPFLAETERVPFGIRYERVGLAALLVAQNLAAKHEMLATEVASIRRFVGMD